MAGFHPYHLCSAGWDLKSQNQPWWRYRCRTSTRAIKHAGIEEVKYQSAGLGGWASQFLFVSYVCSCLLTKLLPGRAGLDTSIRESTQDYRLTFMKLEQLREIINKASKHSSKNGGGKPPKNMHCNKMQYRPAAIFSASKD